MLLNYHIGRLVLSSLCVGAFFAAGISWCSFCRLQPATWANTSRNKSSNTQRTENKTTDVVIQQHSRKLLKMDILISETCWAHKKWNKIASDIKLVFHSSAMKRHHLENRPCMLAGRENARILVENREKWRHVINTANNNSFPCIASVPFRSVPSRSVAGYPVCP